MGLESVGDLTTHIILSKLGPQDTARVACVSKRFRVSASEDNLWFTFCVEDLDLSLPHDPLGNPTPSFKETYKIWRDAFGIYPWPLVKRVKRCWGSVRNWLTTNFPEAEATLLKGASEDEIQDLETCLKVKLPLPTRILYRFCNGQEFRGVDSSLSAYPSLLGIIGGYSCYGHLVNVHLLPLSWIIVQTKEFVRHLGFSSTSKYIVVASSSFSEKYFFLNCSSGKLFVGTKNLLTDGEMIPCVPNALIKSVHAVGGDNQQDAMLLWLEEHGRRLQSGMIKVREEENIRNISMFPEEPPLCSTAVTNGVKVVRASAVFIPEKSDLQGDSDNFLFSYSIRMSLQPEGCIINGMTFGSCQLRSRHWLIHVGTVLVSDVDAEAVIGKFPLLQPGEKEFVYESCTYLPSCPGSIEGAFTFVPGRLAEPKGRPFEAEVARFSLRLPDYVF